MLDKRSSLRLRFGLYAIALLQRFLREGLNTVLLFRFIAALTLIVAVSLVGIALEKQELALKRAISLQHFRMDQLLEERARLRIRLHELSATRPQKAVRSSGRVEIP